MNQIVNWIVKHKCLSIIICFFIFAIPLVIVHLLFKFLVGPQWLQADWDSGDVLAYIAGFEAFLGTVTLGALSLWQNEKMHQEHIESLEPCLSMRLISIGHMLNLVIENTGATEAKEISISLLSITNNGCHTDIETDLTFFPSFELYPKETIQREIAISGADITHNIFPQVKIRVSYVRPDIGRKKEFERSVTYNAGYDKKIVADVNYDNRVMESDIDKIARSNVRIANYLDGHQVCKFDELDILAGKSLRNDLVEAISTKKKAQVLNRTQTIIKRVLQTKRGHYNDTRHN